MYTKISVFALMSVLCSLPLSSTTPIYEATTESDDYSQILNQLNETSAQLTDNLVNACKDESNFNTGEARNAARSIIKLYFELSVVDGTVACVGAGPEFYNMIELIILECCKIDKFPELFREAFDILSPKAKDALKDSFNNNFEPPSSSTKPIHAARTKIDDNVDSMIATVAEILERESLVASCSEIKEIVSNELQHH